MLPRLSPLCAAFVCLAAVQLCVCPTPLARTQETLAVSILVYHRFGPDVPDSMTVRTPTLARQLRYLQEHHYQVISLRALVSYLRHASTAAPPPRSVVITVDDGHRSVFTEMWPLVRQLHVPVTLFIYPSAISNAPYAMTWPQLRTLHDTGSFEIQSHSYWHPNFAIERRRLGPTAYRDFVTRQLMHSRRALEDNLGITADMIAWPFGIYDEGLLELGRECGYVAGFTLDRRIVTAAERIMALPRFLMTDDMSDKTFASMLPAGG